MEPVQFSDLTAANDKLQYRIEFETLISGILAGFADIPVEEIDAAVLHTLRKVGEFAGDDRCYVILFSQDNLYLETVYEWCAEGVPAAAELLRGKLLGSMPWLAEKIQQLETVQMDCVGALSEETRLQFNECLETGTRSMLLVPMTFRGKPVGLMGFDTVRSEKSWSDDESNLLKTIGLVLVATLQRKAAEEALRETFGELEVRVDDRTRELEQRSRIGEALRDILKVLNSNRALPEVLNYIVEQAARLLNATATMIRKADLEHELASTEASYNLPAEFDAIRNSRLYYSANDLILMSRRPVVIADLQGIYQPIMTMPESMDEVQTSYLAAMLKYYRSMLSVPLFIKNEIFGSLTFYFAETRDFVEEEIQLAMSLGDQAALAIENARLYREELIRREEAERGRMIAETLRDIIAVINSPQVLDDILQMIVSEAANLLHTDAAGIYQLKPNEDVLVIRASRGLSEQDARQIRIPVGKGLAGHVVMSRRPVAVSDAASAWGMVADANLLNEEREVLERLVDSYRAFLSVPLLGKDDIYGAITLYYRDARMFLTDEIDLAVAFADQAALAIENAHLRSRSEQAAIATERNRLARELHDAVTQTLFSAAVIAEVLPRLWERDPVEGRARLEELRRLSRAALAEMRALLLELRPSALTETPLSELLTQLAEAVNGRGQVNVSVNVADECGIDPDVKVGLYRIAQEALNNVVKHANASQAHIWMKCISGDAVTPDQLDLIIEDDGEGFDPAHIPPNHLGVGIMRERAQAINATLKIDSQRGAGTRIIVSWMNKTAI